MLSAFLSIIACYFDIIFIVPFDIFHQSCHQAIKVAPSTTGLATVKKIRPIVDILQLL